MSDKTERKIQGRASPGKTHSARGSRSRQDSGGEEAQVFNAEHEKMLHWLKTVRFRKVLFGGISEADMWRKLEELNHLYEASLAAERARYDALLEERTGKKRSAGGDTG